ncbi:hypothetical protein GLOTRDRAFT_134144 [Gloeophyllum trabeum ATCC 11539]|uniref:Uncharacterized protein n=1 Tax=Gloeophyllum trabeum (strain ATCC 11539 / FP-39264 / Madison 617) TaxID=670483 RepID=S7RCT6_GLOTA|nr:uncharacterized protein GLOTRDRAFT_134144 [Gloeophyllum trabeum ATCC 11539]EPQ50219.1 hypothetical protein GLOTRDRAFT_134144 [Gloeophyllum trabeum ATCC 11539]
MPPLPSRPGIVTHVPEPIEPPSHGVKAATDPSRSVPGRPPMGSTSVTGTIDGASRDDQPDSLSSVKGPVAHATPQAPVSQVSQSLGVPHLAGIPPLWPSSAHTANTASSTSHPVSSGGAAGTLPRPWAAPSGGQNAPSPQTRPTTNPISQRPGPIVSGMMDPTPGPLLQLGTSAATSSMAGTADDGELMNRMNMIESQLPLLKERAMQLERKYLRAHDACARYEAAAAQAVSTAQEALKRSQFFEDGLTQYRQLID